MTDGLAALDRITDAVLKYRPKRKAIKARKATSVLRRKKGKSVKAAGKQRKVRQQA